jgi:hypothetical protein
MMMRSLPVGVFAAAATMFFLGFVFFGLLGAMLYTPLDPAAATALKASLGQHLSATGTYMIPPDEEAWRTGPSAIVSFVAAGDANLTGAAEGIGFLHGLVTAFLIALALKASGGDARRQMRVALWYGLAAAVFMHLGDPIWYGFDWRTNLIEFACEAVMIVAGGLVLAKWFTSERAPAA